MKGRALAVILGFTFSWVMGQSNLDVVSTNILFINQEFAKYNPYNTMFRIDKNEKKLIWYNEYGERKALLEDVEFKVTTAKHVGVYCIDGDNCIEQSGSTNTNDYDMTFKDDAGNFPSTGYQIPDKFNEIKRSLGVPVRTSTSSSSSSTSSSSIDYAKIRSNLEYVNAKFASYNSYNTSFELNTSTGELKVKDKFGYIALHISKIEFYLDYTDNYFRVRSKAQRYELQNYSTYGTRQDKAYWSYGLGLSYDGKLISEAPTVVQKLNEIRDMYDVNSPTYTTTALAYVNGMFDKYNDYDAEFGFETSTKLMIFKNEFGMYKSNAADTKYEIDENTHFKVYCSSGTDCMHKYDDYGSRKYGDEINNYTMGLRYSDSVINEGVAVAEILTSIAQVVARGGNSSGSGSSTTTYGNSIDDRLRKINDVFTEHGEYKYTWTVDYTYKQLIGQSSYCTLKINLNELDNIEYYYRSSSTYSSGLKIVSDSKGISEKCSSSETYIDNKYYYLDSEIWSRTVISEMLAIKEMVLQ